MSRESVVVLQRHGYRSIDTVFEILVLFHNVLVCTNTHFLPCFA